MGRGWGGGQGWPPLAHSSPCSPALQVDQSAGKSADGRQTIRLQLLGGVWERIRMGSLSGVGPGGEIRDCLLASTSKPLDLHSQRNITKP